MAQQKRKRRSKHRGNAAGTIEARGRTGRPPSAAEKKKATREQTRELRLNTPPTWKRSLRTSSLAAVLMLLVLTFVEKGSVGTKFVSALIVAVLALLIYTPASYYLELYMWRRRMAKKGTEVKR